ncbi:hypothetical protein DPMN_032206 [Dreissena polymorpha]|uniref:Uncharacterized protein n=1 Tax=Dreissena polymorpha TaxID=45954 RepID=A0A9D4M495_DREPO|nr:hypothetical protein DPMN_032206 [Dreissena polymorpha]
MSVIKTERKVGADEPITPSKPIRGHAYDIGEAITKNSVHQAVNKPIIHEVSHCQPMGDCPNDVHTRQISNIRAMKPGLRTWQFVRPTSRTGRPATELIEELKPTQPDADTDEEEENSALPPSSTVCSVSEMCQFIDHLKNVALAKNNQVMLDSIMKFQDEFFAHRVKCASVQKKISEFF